MHWTEAWARSTRGAGRVVEPQAIEPEDADEEIQHDLISQQAVMVGATAVITTAAVVAFLKLIGSILQAYGVKIGGIVGGS
jgi:hypothetical protein